MAWENLAISLIKLPQLLFNWHSSIFIHPGEASHGDLGMITENDVVILLSNSGETKELKDIIYYCKRFEIPIIGIIRRRESELTKASNVAPCFTSNS